MLFTELMHAIHPHLMKDADVPSFTRNIIQMLCDIPKEDWYTKKDPSSAENYKDETLRKYYNRGLSNKLDIVNPELENDRKIRQGITSSNKAKGTFGAGLLDDCKYTCFMPLCGKHLQTTDSQNHNVADYEVILIDDAKGSKYDNLVAVCHDCFQKYSLSHTKKILQ